jgi:hypothetical protein
MISRRLLPSAAALAAGLLVQIAGFAQTPTSSAVKPAASPDFIIIPEPVFIWYPGQVALQINTLFGSRGNYYLAAPNGGGRTVDALVTSATGIGPNERFTVEVTDGQYWNFITAAGDYVSVPLPYGTNLKETTQTVLTAPADTSLFTVHRSDYIGDTVLGTYYDEFLYFRNDGGESTAAIGTYQSSVPASQDGNVVMPRQCGALGSGYNYSIQTGTWGGGGGDFFYFALGAVTGVEYSNAYSIALAEPGELGAQFTLIQQSDGSYAIQTIGGNYVWALNGGGVDASDSLLVVTNPPQGNASEHFWITDQGNCTYTIQTSSGYYLAWNIAGTKSGDFQDPNPNDLYTLKLSTDISNPAAAPSVGFNAYFVLRPLWN